MKQTAVEWLVNEIPSIDWENSYWRNRFEQAKEIEKQQIIDARVKKPLQSEWDETEQYYNEQFKNK
jgi:hypothetical protein